MAYQSSKYWESEEPEVLRTKRNVIKLFRQAGKLQVSHPDWQDGYGETKQGKTVTIDLSEPGVIDFLHMI